MVRLSLTRPSALRHAALTTSRERRPGRTCTTAIRFETSAKDNINVDKAMMTLIQTVLADEGAAQPAGTSSPDAIKLSTSASAGTPAETSYCSGCLK